MLQSFKQYFTEEEHIELEVDPKLALSNLDKVNEDLDAVTINPFMNSAIFVNAVRGTLERYGIVLPAHSNMQQLSMEGEWVYALGDSGHFVYMVHNLNDEGQVEGYAQIVDQEELDDLASLNDDSDSDELAASPGIEPVRKYPPARRDDDSGNTAEYA